MEISGNPFRPHFLNVDVSAEAEDFIQLNLISYVYIFLIGKCMLAYVFFNNSTWDIQNFLC